MLTEKDKQGIKQAILKAVENGCQEPECMLTKILKSFERIENFGRTIRGEDSESVATRGGTC